MFRKMVSYWQNLILIAIYFFGYTFLLLLLGFVMTIVNFLIAIAFFSGGALGMILIKFNSTYGTILLLVGMSLFSTGLGLFALSYSKVFCESFFIFLQELYMNLPNRFERIKKQWEKSKR